MPAKREHGTRTRHLVPNRPGTRRARLVTLPLLLAAADSSSFWQTFGQYVVIGLTNGALFALVALGYTMVYGIIELINFAHGDVFMLGSFLALAIIAGLKSHFEIDLEAAAGTTVLLWI